MTATDIPQEDTLINDQNNFIAQVRGHRVFITSNHTYGESMVFSKTRYSVEVENLQTKEMVISELIDKENIREAIKYALKHTMS